MDDHDTDLATLLHDAVADVEPTDRLAEIRQAASPTPRRTGWYAAGSGLLAAAVAAGVVALVANQTSPSADETGPATPTTQAIAVYYVGETPRGARLYREFHQVQGGDELAAAIVEISRPPDDKDYVSWWSPDQLESASVRDGVIRIEVSDAVVAPTDGIVLSHIGLQQLIFTVQAAAEERLPVQFVHDGNPVAEVFGQPASEPVTNDAPLDVLSLVSVSDPVEGLVVTDSFIARGAASSFEGNVPWELRGPDGALAREGFATAGMDPDHLIAWETESIDVSDLPPGVYTFEARTEGGTPFTDTRTVVIE